MMYALEVLLKSKVVIPACIAVAFALALGGILQSAELAHRAMDWSLASYLALQLFTLQAGNYFEAQHTHWLLNFMRFLAPLTGMATIALGAARVFHKQLQVLLVSWTGRHVIVLGETTDTIHLLSSMMPDARVIVVCRRASERVLALCASRRYVVYEAEIGPTVWRRVGLAKCTMVIVDTADDYNNLRIGNELLEIYQRPKSKLKGRIQVFVNIEDSELVSTLEEFDLFRQQHGGFDASIYNAAQLKSRLLMMRHAPDLYHPAQAKSDHPPRISVLIDSATGVEFLKSLYRHCHWLNHKRTPIRVFIHKAEAIQPEIVALAKRVDKWFDTTVHDLHGAEDCDDVYPAEIVYVLFSDVYRQYELLREIVRLAVDRRCTVLADIANELRSNTPLFKEERVLRLIDLSREAISFENITRSSLDQLAIAINASYNNVIGSSRLDKESAWLRLSEDFRNANRNVADHIEWKLRLLGLRSVSLSDSREPQRITREMVNRDCLILEHNRWWAERIVAGWKRTDKEKNAELKLHHLMVDFAKLDQKHVELDRNNYLSIGAVLESEGRKVVKADTGKLGKPVYPTKAMN